MRRGGEDLKSPEPITCHPSLGEGRALLPSSPPHHKEHLPLVLVREQEEAQHCRVGDLVVEGLAVEVQEGGVDTDVVSPARRQTLQFPEDADGIAGGLDHVRLGEDVLSEGLQEKGVTAGCGYPATPSARPAAPLAPRSPPQGPRRPPGSGARRSEPP